LSTELLDKEKIRTTLAKAKELRPFAEKIITMSKRETLHARRRVLRLVRDKKVVAKLFDTISARFAQRPGGYTRIIKLGPRKGDNSELAIIELVGAETVSEPAAASPATETKPAAKAAGKKKAAKRAAAPKKASRSRGKSETAETKAPAKKKRKTKAPPGRKKTGS
jgi:large subunit ribosomal protein L17